MAYKQLKFVSHSSGGWEAQNQGTGRLCGTYFLVHRWNLLSLFSTGVKNSVCSLVLTGLLVSPILDCSVLKTKSPPKGLFFFKYHHLEVTISTWGLPLRALDDLPEDPSLIPSTHMATPGDLMPSSGF